jgi:hypothetical protein
MKGYWIFLFWSYWNNHVIIITSSIFVLYYGYWFAYVETSLYPWNETNLIIMYNLFNVLLNLLCKYFIENFCVYVH